MKLLRIRTLFRKDQLDAEMAAEMRHHVELQAELNVKAGMKPDEARHAALRQFGNVAGIQEQAREGRGWVWLEQLGSDLRQAGRRLAMAPVVSLVIVLSLGVGIGVNTAIFSWMQGLVFRPLPGVAQTARLLLVEPRAETGSYPGCSWAEYRELQETLTAWEELFAFRMLPLNLGPRGQEVRAFAQLVSGNYFSGLGLRPALGRLLRTDEVIQPGTTAVAVISHDFWVNRLAGAGDVVGREIELNDRHFTIVGVAPEGFHGTVLGLSFDLWLPATMAPELLGGSPELTDRDVRGYSVSGRLRPGVTEAQARTELNTAMRQLAVVYPAANAAMGAEIMPFWQAPRGAARLLLGGLAALQGFMLLVLLVVCVNAANLLLARATARQREIGVRLALGARPGQIFRLLLTESVVLGLLASGLGLVLAVWGTEALRSVPLPGGFPLKLQTEIEATGLGLTLLLGFGCAVLFGFAPAWLSARTDAQLAWRTARQLAGRKRVRSFLVALEVALALLALIAAAMFMRSFLETRTADPGFKPEGVLLGAYDLTSSGYDQATGLAVMDDLLRRLGAEPGVEAAAVATWVPLDFHAMPSASFTLDGRGRSDGGKDRALAYTVTPGYLKTLGLTLVEGRDFVGLADRAAPAQVIVNEEFVRRFLAGAPALGHRIAGRRGSSEIIGVVQNSLYENFGEPAKPLMYFSYRDRFSPGGQIHVRLRGTGLEPVPDLRRIVREINPAIMLYEVRTLTEHVDKNLFFRRIPARLFAVLGPLILLLAAVGIYALVAYNVAQRTTEIGVRLALGASSRQVVAQIVGECLRVVAFGALPAWILAFVVMLHLRGRSGNMLILLGVPAVLFGVAAMAAWLPARRAAKVDPMVALRAE